MGKIDWKNIEVIEEWAVIDPSDQEAIGIEKWRIRELSRLILTAFLRHRREKTLKKLKKVSVLGRECESKGVQTPM